MSREMVRGAALVMWSVQGTCELRDLCVRVGRRPKFTG